ncbi:uncharacterized protein PG986_008033 [Apiospora aurea]|uniref:Integral membrane protein n=1 Tax=Apiospora aurea TaxID=335848 RepID=A0ABR1QFQ5_9PEZI
MSSPSSDADPQPPAFNYVLGFLMVGVAWGFTTPFIRRAARDHNPPPHPILEREDIKSSGLKSKLYGGVFAILDLLRNPPICRSASDQSDRQCLVLLADRASWYVRSALRVLELSLTVPIVNTLAFLFTVLGEWWVEKKVISKDTWIGMALSLCGIALCVHSKSN